MINHFYIHIPFCKQKCPYCKFALTPVFDEFKKKRYIEYLKKEIKEYFFVPISVCEFGESVSADFCEKSQTVGVIASFCDLRNQTVNRFQNEVEEIKTFGTFSHKSTGTINNEDLEINSGGQKSIYFGGGTPSILNSIEVKEILECFPFYRKTETEITLEANPEDINQDYITGLLSLGINRISLGIQTLNGKSLTEIHRSNQKSIFNALESIGSRPGLSLNTDFILGLPYVQPGETLNDIKRLHKKFPLITHTSVYMLEDDIYPKDWKGNSITENELQSEFLEIINYLESIGWNHYELSNWAKPGYESVHNRAYWNHSDSRGFGLAAANYENKQRWNNAESFNGYYTGKIENKEILTKEQIEIEDMMFGLRTDGWNIDIQTITSPGKIQKCIDNGLIEMNNDTIKPTKTGIFMIDHIMSELI